MQSHAKPYLFLLLAAAIGVVVCGGRVPSLPVSLSIRGPDAASPRSADAAVRQLLAGVNENRWEVLWDALPASYQRDVDDVLHLFAKRVPPEIWKRGVRLAEASAALMKTYHRQTEKAPRDSHEREFSFAVTGTLAKALDSITKSELSRPERVQSISCRSLLQAVARNVIAPLRSSLAKVPTLLALPDDFRTIEVRLKETAGDAATVACTFPGLGDDDVEIELVRVEGKWIPRTLADGWRERITTLKAEINRERTDAEREEIATFLTQLEGVLAAMSLAASQQGETDDDPPSLMQGLILAGYLMGGPPAIEPDFHKQTQKLLDGKDTTVLVMCYAPKELKWDNDAVESELAKHLADRFTANKIKVVDPDRVHDWLDKHNDWEKATEVGAAFEVNYVVHVDLKAYSLFEENSHELYRGRADAIVTVFEMDDNKQEGHVIYSKNLQSRFPTSGPVLQSTYAYADFKKMYLSTLSQQIGTLLYEHFAGDDSPNLRQE